MPSHPRVLLATDRPEGSATRNIRQAEPPSANTCRIRWITLILLLMFTFGAHAETLNGRVVGVTDGDTVTVLDAHNVMHKIRLSGIDAPEITQAYGTRSKKHLSDLVFQKDVWVQWHKRDRYGRIVGKVMLQASPDCPTCVKGIDAGHAQLGSGLAWWYRTYAEEQSPDDSERYETEEAVARASRFGLWSDAAPVPPWQFRKPDDLRERPRLGHQASHAVVTVQNLKVHVGQSSRSTIQARLNKGERVDVIDPRGKWWLIDPAGPAVPGYVSSRHLESPHIDESRSNDSPPHTLRRNTELAKKIITESIARFPGKCPCPYSTDQAGRRCGARSAYARPRGLSPMCYESDVPDRMLRASR